MTPPCLSPCSKTFLRGHLCKLFLCMVNYTMLLLRPYCLIFKMLRSSCIFRILQTYSQIIQTGARGSGELYTAEKGIEFPKVLRINTTNKHITKLCSSAACVIGKSLGWENVVSPSNQMTVIYGITIGLQRHFCLPKCVQT